MTSGEITIYHIAVTITIYTDVKRSDISLETSVITLNNYHVRYAPVPADHPPDYYRDDVI